MNKVYEKDRIAEKRIKSSLNKVTKYKSHIYNWLGTMQSGLPPYDSVKSKNHIRICLNDYVNHIQPKLDSKLKLKDALIEALGDTSPQQHSLKRSILSSTKLLARYLNHIELISSKQLKSILDITVKSRSKPITNHLKPSEVKAVLDYLQKRDEVVMFTILKVICFTGVRICGIIDLELIDINLEEALITFKNQKGGKNQILGINKELKPLLEKYLNIRAQTNHPHLFINPVNNKPFTMDYLQGKIKSIHKAVGIRFGGFHPYRRYFAKSFTDKGVPVTQMQAALGHSSLTTTLRYINLDENEIASNMKSW